MQLILVILGFLTVVAVAGGIGYMYYRRVLREAKNYERGLKMVPLLIHLPPLSDDIDAGGRDLRDVTEETISKAQVLYNIIASTATKGFKSKFYGQRHIAFEIVAAKGVVNYYTAVPVTLVSVVEQAVTSAYPSARLEEVEEHNLFNEAGRISGTIGGELVLKKDFANPIATFQETKRDSMQAILNSLSTLSKEDGAGIQILLRPAHEGWTKKALGVASKKKKDKGKKSGLAGIVSMKEISEALWKPPEAKDSKPEDKQLSSLEQATVDAIEDKTRHPGYEVLIRLVASSNASARSQTILSNMVASFSLFDAPGRNGFKFVPAKAMENFVTAFIFRFFPPEINQNVLNSVELATIFHFPDQRNTPTSQLQRQASKQVDGPTNLSEHGLLLGYNVFRGTEKAIRLTDDDRRRHMYIVGQTGTGKSTVLENLALQDMMDGKGFAFVDPHGDAVETLLSMVPKERTEDIIYFAPFDMDYPVGLNLFEFQLPQQRDFLIQEAINMLYKLYDPTRQGIIGPRYEHLFRMAALTVMAGPGGGTFIDIPKLFSDKQYVNQKLKYVTDTVVLDFWQKEMPGSERSNEFGEVKSWFVSKFGAFLGNEMMRNIIGQAKSGFDLREIMDGSKILLVNLSKGKMGELNAKLLGMIFVMKFYTAAMGRANIPEAERKDFSLYVDEFQNFSTESFSDVLSEARKYHLSLVVANQFIGQLTEDVRDAVFGNVGTVMSLRTGANDADFLVKYFSPVFDVEDLTKMPNHSAAVQMLMNGVPTQPFSMNTIPPLGNPNAKLRDALKRLSAAKYGRPRALVEKEIFERLKTDEPPRPAFGNRPALGAPGSPSLGAGAPSSFGQRPLSALGSSTAPKAQPPGSASFLDEWLSKRRQQMATKPAMPPASAGHVPPTPSNLHPPAAPAHHAPAAKPQFGSLSSSHPAPTTGSVHPPSAPAHPAPERPKLEPVHPDAGLQQRAAQDEKARQKLQEISKSGKHVEDIVVPTGTAVKASAGEANSALNQSIQEGTLAEGEIDIDPQGLIHHSKDEEEELNS
jgi:hypothetical protein